MYNKVNLVCFDVCSANTERFMYASRKEELHFATFCFCFYRKCRGVTTFQANKLKLLLVF